MGRFATEVREWRHEFMLLIVLKLSLVSAFESVFRNCRKPPMEASELAVCDNFDL